ncbi:hypothetical protein V5799_002833 [Amblyomma americanum]|uniref:Globin domain-containing protein n=1 Tax=Amblyomma americanum TaxID=6943 RepID=A0AAQ4DAP5_AMBAM
MGKRLSRMSAGQVDPRTGMSDREKRLVLESWRRFCEKNPNYGVLLLLGMFTKHPEYLKLFRSFKGRNLRTLHDDPKFRAHASAVGHQLSAMVECLDEPVVLIELIRKNAIKHRAQPGLRAENFEGLFSAVLSEIIASDRCLMTHDTVKAWERLFEVRYLPLF